MLLWLSVLKCVILGVANVVSSTSASSFRRVARRVGVLIVFLFVVFDIWCCWCIKIEEFLCVIVDGDVCWMFVDVSVDGGSIVDFSISRDRIFRNVTGMMVFLKFFFIVFDGELKYFSYFLCCCFVFLIVFVFWRRGAFVFVAFRFDDVGVVRFEDCLFEFRFFIIFCVIVNVVLNDFCFCWLMLLCCFVCVLFVCSSRVLGWIFTREVIIVALLLRIVCVLLS